MQLKENDIHQIQIHIHIFQLISVLGVLFGVPGVLFGIFGVLFGVPSVLFGVFGVLFGVHYIFFGVIGICGIGILYFYI